MSLRLQELHPSLVHYPLAFLPLAVGADLLGRATGNTTLSEMGRLGMALAAGSAAVTAAAGLAAQEEVNVEPGTEAYDMLVTHRTLNLSAVLGATAMATWRWRQEQASPAYLALGLAALGTVGYSAYLGGKMVYKHGLGVEAAGGVKEGHPVPHVTRDTLAESAGQLAHDVAAGAATAVRQMGEGDVLPMVTRSEPEAR